MVLDHKQLTCGSQTTSITLQISTVTNVEWRIWQSVFSWQRDCSSKPSEGPDAKLIGVIFSMCIFWSNMYIIFLYIHYLVWQIILENIKSFIRYDYLMLEWAGQMSFLMLKTDTWRRTSQTKCPHFYKTTDTNSISLLWMHMTIP